MGQATVEAPMSNISDFPFDLHDVPLRFQSVSSWQTLDMSDSGERVSGASYKLRCTRMIKKQCKAGSRFQNPFSKTNNCTYYIITKRVFIVIARAVSLIPPHPSAYHCAP